MCAVVRVVWFTETWCSQRAQLPRQLMQQQQNRWSCESPQRVNCNLCVFHAALFISTGLRTNCAASATSVHKAVDVSPEHVLSKFRWGEFLCAQIPLVVTVTDKDVSLSTVGVSLTYDPEVLGSGSCTLWYLDLRPVCDAGLSMQQGHASSLPLRISVWTWDFWWEKYNPSWIPVVVCGSVNDLRLVFTSPK